MIRQIAPQLFATEMAATLAGHSLGPGRLAFAGLDTVTRTAGRQGRCPVEPVSSRIVREQISVTRRACIPPRQRFRMRPFEMPVTLTSPHGILAYVVTFHTL